MRVQTLTGERAAASPPARLSGAGIWDVLRLVLLVPMLGLLVAIPLTGQKESTWSELLADVHSGDVAQVVVTEELWATETGSQGVQVRWRDGLAHRYTWVRQVRGTGGGGGGGSTDLPRLHTAPSQLLQEMNPSLVVVRGEERWAGAHVFGWEISGHLQAALVVSWFLGLLLLVVSPWTWRASLWGWFWLMLVGYPGTVAYLLLSGPTPLVPIPRHPNRRLTGGWAFLLLVVVTTIWDRAV